MKQKLFILLLLFSTLAICAYAQKLKFSYSAGTALGEMKFLKKNMPFKDFTFGYENKSKSGLFLTSGLGVSVASFDYYDSLNNAVFAQRIFIILPVTLTQHYTIQNHKNISFFFGLGILASFSVENKKEIRNFISVKKENNSFTGFNLAVGTQIGSRFMLSDKSFLDISVSNQLDFLTHYSDEAQKIKFQKNLFSFSYVKTISRSKL